MNSLISITKQSAGLTLMFNGRILAYGMSKTQCQWMKDGVALAAETLREKVRVDGIEHLYSSAPECD